MPRVFSWIKKRQGWKFNSYWHYYRIFFNENTNLKTTRKKRVQTYSNTTTRLFKVFERIFRGFFFSFMKIQEFTNFYFQNLGVPVDLIQPFKTIKLIQNLSWWVGFWDRRVNIVLFNQSIKGLFPKKFSSIVQRILRVLRKNKFEP